MLSLVDGSHHSFMLLSSQFHPNFGSQRPNMESHADQHHLVHPSPFQKLRAQLVCIWDGRGDNLPPLNIPSCFLDVNSIPIWDDTGKLCIQRFSSSKVVVKRGMARSYQHNWIEELNILESSETTGGQPKIVMHSNHFLRPSIMYPTLFKQ